MRFHLGRLFGINTYLHWSFWLLPGLMFVAGYLSGGVVQAVLDTAVILAIFGCVALHEVGHALAARWYHIRTHDITLYPIGGVAQLERISRNPTSEIVIALAGPAVNVAIVMLLLPLLLIDGYGITNLTRGAGLMEVFWTKLLWANVGLVLFNLIPAFPMDGGRVLRALLSTGLGRLKATETAAAISTGFAILFGVGGLLGWTLPVIGTLGPMAIILALVLHYVGQQELEQVRHEERRFWPPRGQPLRTAREFVPVAHRPDGWEYDPQSRLWTYWLHGRPLRQFQPECRL
jgi:Zn-dependent protease